MHKAILSEVILPDVILSEVCATYNDIGVLKLTNVVISMTVTLCQFNEG